MDSLAEAVVLDVDVANTLIEAAVSKCLKATRTESDRPVDYDRSMFWELYKRIADEFVFDFDDITEESVPLRWILIPGEYLCGIWKGYFENEIAEIIASEPKFADLVDGAIANPNNYFRYTERIDALLRKRFNILESSGGHELKRITLGELKSADLIRIKSQFEELRQKAYGIADPIEKRDELISIKEAESRLINSKQLLDKLWKLIDAGQAVDMYMFRGGRNKRYPLDGYSGTDSRVGFTDEDGCVWFTRDSFDMSDDELTARAEVRRLQQQ